MILAALLLAAAPPRVVLSLERVEPDGKFRHLPGWRAPALPRWGVALGAGSAWGPAHLGVLRAMEEDGLVPDLAAGTSAGALVAADLAGGYGVDRSIRLLERDDFARSIFAPPPRAAVGAPPDPLDEPTSAGRVGRDREGRRLPFRGLVHDGTILLELRRYLARPDALSEGDFDRLAIPMRAVTTDLVHAEKFAPGKGDLVRAIRASVGIPVLSPTPWEGRLLADGGLVERVPAPTLRAMAADVVVAVELTADGKAASDGFDASGFAGILFRNFDVSIASQREGQREAADAWITVAVGDASLTSFADSLPTLLHVGEGAWRDHRDEVFAALEGSARDRRVFRVARVVPAAGTPDDVARRIARRILPDGAPREVSAVRIESALAAEAGRLDATEAAVAIAEDGTVEATLVPSPPVRKLLVEADGTELALDPAPGRESPGEALERVERAVDEARGRGRFLAGVREVDWNPESGELRVVVEPGTVSGAEVRERDGEARASAALSRLSGRPADLERIRRIAARGEARGAWRSPRAGRARRMPDGTYGIEVEVEPMPRWIASWTAGFPDALRPTLWGSLARPPQRPGGVGWDARVVSGVEGTLLSGEAALVRDVGAMPFARLSGGNFRRPGAESFGTVAAKLGFRLGPGRCGRLEAGLAARHVGERAFRSGLPADPGTDLALDGAWDGDRRDDPSIPTRGIAWSVAASAPLAGAERPALASADFEGYLPLSSSGRFSAGALVRGAWAEVGDPLPLDRWSEAGAFVEAPGMTPGRATAPRLRRAAVVLRARLGAWARSPLVVGGSVASWRLGEVRAEPELRRDGRGASLFVELGLPRLTKVSVGVTRGRGEGDGFFFLMGSTRVPWGRVAGRHPGR